MMFTLNDTKQRYRNTLAAMESEKSMRVGASWEGVKLGFFFSDRERGVLSVRDTLVPLLTADRRTLNGDILKDLCDALTLEQACGETARQIHRAYIASAPIG